LSSVSRYASLIRVNQEEKNLWTIPIVLYRKRIHYSSSSYCNIVKAIGTKE
jgi:hypothetical protein